MTQNQYVDAYSLPINFGRELERRAEPLVFQSCDLNAQTEELRSALSRIFICGVQVKSLIKMLLALGQAHAITHCSSGRQMVSDVYSLNPWGTASESAIMLIGLAGVGKTECVRAIQRLLSARLATIDLPMHRGMALVPAWFISMLEASSLDSMLRPQLDLVRSDLSGRAIRQDKLLELSRRASRRDGTCLVFVDELQFQTHGSQANTRVTGQLLALLSMGPRLIYVCNYSLAHKLKARRQEDQQRLLANPLVLEPDPPESPCFQRLLREYFSVLQNDFPSNPSYVAEDIHRYTFGIKRAIVNLLCIAWRIAKTKRGAEACVGLDDFRSAYLSPQYSFYRDDTEALWRHSMGGRGVREDLVNPFHEHGSRRNNVVTANAAIETWKREVASSHVFDTMTPAERAAEIELSSLTLGQTSTAKKVVRLKRDLSSKVALLDALDRFDTIPFKSTD